MASAQDQMPRWSSSGRTERKKRLDVTPNLLTYLDSTLRSFRRLIKRRFRKKDRHLWFACIATTISACLIVTLLCDYGIPIVGNYAIPPRSQRPSHLRNGLMLVDTERQFYPAVADIIFVHGLGAFPDSTWQKPLSGEKKRHPEAISWIRDILPNDIPNARLMFFNYDSTTYNDAPKKNLEDIGDEFLHAIESSGLRVTEEEQNRPIILVCHSYGGLVVKEALRIASSEKYTRKTEHPILRTTGIVFLGVPHRGTEYSGWAREAALRLDRLGSNPDIFVPLAVDSPQLAELHTTFMQRFSHLKMVNFFETRRLVLCKAYFWISHSVMIVTKDSATFESDNTENHSLDYDHSGLNKYNSADDQGYRKIKFTLRQMMQLIVESRQRIQLKHDNDLASNSSSGIPPPNNKLVISSEYSVGPQTSPFFIERPTLRSLLEKCIRDADNTRVLPRSVALWGAGGAGKTQLALRFAEQHRHVYNPIIWVEADTALSIIKSYSRAFEALGLDFPSTVLDEERKDSKEDVIQLKNHWVIKSVLDYLESRTEAHSEWLVIINNADHLDLLPSTIPRGSRGSVIITTRDKMADRFVSHPIEVGDLSTDEAIELLLQGIPPSTGMFSELAVSSDEADHTDSSEKPASNVLEKRQAYAIIERLGHMAFPLALANSYIRQHDHVREDLSLYLSFVDRASFATLNTEGTTLFDPRHSSLASVFETSFSAIGDVSNDSTTLFLLLAKLNPANIDDRLFREAALGLSEPRRPTATQYQLDVLVLSYYSRGFILMAHVLQLRRFTWAKKKAWFQWTTVLSMTGFCLYMCVNPFLCIQALDKRIQNGDTVWQSSSELLSSGLDYGAIMTASGAPFWLAVKAGVIHLGGYPIHFMVMAQTMLIIGATSLYQSWHHKAVKRHTTDLLDRLNFSGTDLSRFELLLQDPSPDRTILKIIIAELRLVTFSLAFPVFLIVFLSLWSLLIQPGTILGDNWFFFNAQYLERVKHHPLTRAGLSQLKRFFRFFLPLCDFVIPSIIVFIYPIAHNALDFTETFSLSHKMLSVVGEPLEPQFLDGLLSHTDHLQWYAVPYSTAASHIARFGLLHRTHGEHDGGYTMHPLAKQWAQERLGILESNAFTLESYRLIALAHRSPSCWGDVTCQRLLIPHLLSLATSGIVEADEEQGDIGTYKRMEHVLRMLCYSLMKLEEL